MTHLVLNWGNFLYFPEDKSTYLPAAIELLLIIIFCVFVFKFVRKISAKEAAKAKRLEQEILNKKVAVQSKLDE